MWQEDYFKELSRMLNLRGVKTGVTENNGLPVMLGDAVVCRINSAGQPFRVPGDLSGEAAAKLFIKASRVASEVAEYMKAMDAASSQSLEGMEKAFPVLAKYNGVVLAASRLEDAPVVRFITWQRDNENVGMIRGHYYDDDYLAAKSDFAIRSGLVNELRVFSPEQMVEIYRSVDHTLNAKCANADAEEILVDILERIRIALHDLDERLRRQAYKEHGFCVDIDRKFMEGGI